MTKYIYTLAARRKTIRKFSSRPVAWNDVVLAIQSACQAPSGANAQPWRFMIVTDPQIKGRIRKACEQGEIEFYANVKDELRDWLVGKGLNWRKPFLEDAPVLILVFSEHKAPYSLQSVWLAIGYLLLVLEERGLGTVTYTPSNTQGVLDALEVPEEFRLEAILPIGVPADDKPKEHRRQLEEVTFFNSWGRHTEILN